MKLGEDDDRTQEVNDRLDGCVSL